MTIVHVTCGFLEGGVGAMVQNLLLAQIQAEQEVVVVGSPTDKLPFESWCKQYQVSIPFYEIASYRTPKMTAWGALSHRMYKKLSHTYGKENLIFHFHNPITCGLLGYIPPHSICTIHGLIGQITNKKISNTVSTLIFKRLLRKNVQLIGCCQAVADFINRQYHTTQCVGVLNGLEKVSKTSSTYIQPNGKIHIGYVSYIDELKGWHILAEAYEKLSPAAHQRCDLTFAGGIFPPEKTAFEQFVHKWSDVSYVGYLKNARSILTPHLDVLVLPSRSEGLPMTLLEAMQHGVIPVATAVGGIPELIENGKSGYLIKRDALQLAQLLEQIISHPQQLPVMKAQTKQRFEQIGTSRRMAEQYMQLYQKILKEQRN